MKEWIAFDVQMTATELARVQNRFYVRPRVAWLSFSQWETGYDDSFFHVIAYSTAG